MNLEQLRPNLYPTYLLDKCDSGLCLFGAGFYGANDAIHMYNAGLDFVSVVDSDDEKVKVMEAMYPHRWSFLTSDVTTWVPNVANNSFLNWDIVSVDSPTNMFSWVIDNLGVIAKLSNKYVVVTMHTEVADLCRIPEWELVTVMNRSLSGLVELLVFKWVGA